MWIDPIRTMGTAFCPPAIAFMRPGESRSSNVLETRGCRGSAFTARCGSPSHVVVWRLNDYPSLAVNGRGFRLSLTLPCTSVRVVVE
jgi:hypothetical protein